MLANMRVKSAQRMKFAARAEGETTEWTACSTDDVLAPVEFKKKKNRSLWVHPILFLSEETGSDPAVKFGRYFYFERLLRPLAPGLPRERRKYREIPVRAVGVILEYRPNFRLWCH